MENLKYYYDLCERAYSTLSIVSDQIDSDDISNILSIAPTTSKIKGDMFKDIRIKNNGWFLSSEGMLSSTDICEHIDWVLDKLKDKEEIIKSLQSKGCRVTVSCFWLSKYGRGGPVLEAKQIFELAKFNIPIGWDISFKDTSGQTES